MLRYPKGIKRKISLNNNSKLLKIQDTSSYILNMLLDTFPYYLSGNDLANSLKMSRVGIWSRINQLRKAGIQIEATQNMGYRIVSEPNGFNSNLLSAWLQKIAIEIGTLEVSEKVSSTNTLAEQYLSVVETKCPVLVVANQQTDGKGRFNRKWVSPKGGNIYLSLGFRPNADAIKLRLFTLYLGVEIAKFLSSYLQLENINIKWPNDIYLNGKKIGGLLTEAQVDCERIKTLILGIGLNINKPPAIVENSLKEISTSISKEIGKKVLIHEMTAKLTKVCIDSYIKCLSKNMSEEILKCWPKYDFLLNRKVEITYGKKKIKGKSFGIEENSGGIKIKLTNGHVRVFHSGEVSIRA